MTLSREELAAHLMCAYIARDASSDVQHYKIFFDLADTFLAYAAKEREKGKPKAECEHLWVSDGGECYYCQWCNVPKVKVDKQAAKPDCGAPKVKEPERKAREMWLTHWMNGTIGEPIHIMNPGKPGGEVFEYIKVREILPGEEG